jgi:hypothetical protein
MDIPSLSCMPHSQPISCSLADEEDLSTHEFSEYYINCTSDSPTSKICLAGIFESRKLRSNHYGQYFLTMFPKIYPLVQTLFGHTHYIHIIPTFIYM